MGLGLRKLKPERQPWGKRAWRKYVTRKARRLVELPPTEEGLPPVEHDADLDESWLEDDVILAREELQARFG